MSDIEKYIIVSQGIVICSFDLSEKQKAIDFVKTSNKEWNRYKQNCLDNHENYADNECFLYGEKDDGEIELIEVN